jgi:hypothetical protein
MTREASILTTVLFFSLIGSGTAYSQFPPFQFLQKPGPYSVGLKIVIQYDPSRKFPATPDRPEAPAGRGTRPLQTLIWYPAQQGKRKPMAVVAMSDIQDARMAYARSVELNSNNKHSKGKLVKLRN